MNFLLLALIIIFLLMATVSQNRAALVRNIRLDYGTIIRAESQAFGISEERIIGHIATESKQPPRFVTTNLWAIRNDKSGESYYPNDVNDAMIKLSQWENSGYNIRRVSIGLMQLVPDYGLTDFNRAYSKQYGIIEMFNARQNLEAGVGYLALLKTRLGSIDKASRQYNGSLTNPLTAKYLDSVKAYELIALANP